MHRLCAPLVALATLTTTVYPSVAHSQVSQVSQTPVHSGQVRPVAAAALAPSLTLAEAIQLAWQFSPELQSAERNRQASEGAVIQSGARPNPALQVLLEDTRAATRTTTVQVSQPIELGGQRAARISVAELSHAQVVGELEARRAQVRADVTQAYFAQAVAQERVRLAEASAGLASQALEAVAKRVLAGKVSPVEETRAKVAQAAARLELVQAQGEMRVTLQHLGSLVGRPTSGLQAVDWDLAMQSTRQLTPDVIASLAPRLPSAPMLQQARLEVDRRRALADLEQAKRMPDVTVTLGSKRAQELGRNQAVIGVSLPLPVWDTNQGNVLQALRLQDKAQADLAATQILVDTQWRQLSERFQLAHAEVQALEQDVLPGAESVWRAAVTGFELGKFSFLETLDAQRTLFQARAQYLRAMGDKHRAAADMDRLLGTDASEAPEANSQKASQ